jgi:hypothetical protein
MNGGQAVVVGIGRRSLNRRLADLMLSSEDPDRRQQRIVLAKLVAALNLPSGLVDGLAPAAEKPKQQRNRKTKFQVVRDNPGMA